MTAVMIMQQTSKIIAYAIKDFTMYLFLIIYFLDLDLHANLVIQLAKFVALEIKIMVVSFYFKILI